MTFRNLGHCIEKDVRPCTDESAQKTNAHARSLNPQLPYLFGPKTFRMVVVQRMKQGCRVPLGKRFADGLAQRDVIHRVEKASVSVLCMTLPSCEDALCTGHDV